jgi:peptide-methionine (R)-S-oxide reductase
MTDFAPDLPRRALLAGAVGGAFVVACGKALATPDAFAASPFRKLSDAEWKKRLPAPAYRVLRHEATEVSFTSPLLNQHGAGVFACLGCGLPLFRSRWKYDSGTGWPSFWTVLPGAVTKKADFAIGVPRTEYHCARCLGHQGHVFDDGPKPTGLRYCNNGVALNFVKA